MNEKERVIVKVYQDKWRPEYVVYYKKVGKEIAKGEFILNSEGQWERFEGSIQDNHWIKMESLTGVMDKKDE